MGLLELIFNPRRVFRPEVEALLDAEMKRHRQQIEKLTAYALQQQDVKAAEAVKDRASGGIQSNAERTDEGLDEAASDEG